MKLKIYIGVGLLAFLIIYCSTRKVVLKEISSDNIKKTFDNSNLPFELKPPYMLEEGEVITLEKKNNSFNGLGLFPRFDI